MEINFGYKNYKLLSKLVRINELCEEIKLQNIFLSKAESACERKVITLKIEFLEKRLRRAFGSVEHLQNCTSLVKALIDTKISIINQISCVYVTFLAMETRDLVLEKLLRFDSHTPQKLRFYYLSKQSSHQPYSRPRLLSIFGFGPKQEEPGLRSMQTMGFGSQINKMVPEKEYRKSKTIQDPVRLSVKDIQSSQQYNVFNDNPSS